MGKKMVYSDIEIKNALKRGHILIYPLNESHIKGSSVDITLGEYFFTTDRTNNAGGFYNPYDEDDVRRYFGEPKKAMPNGEWCEKKGRMPFKGIPEEHPIIVLQPHERILAHTHEFIGINPPGTTEMRARSSVGRSGIVVCKCAGWGDPGYTNRWTMEVQNDNDESVPLPVGERVGQIVFHQTGPVESHYGIGGKYHRGKLFSQVVANWGPHDMLPKAFEDMRALPPPISIDEVVELEAKIERFLAEEQERLEQEAASFPN
jgi:dCTP deaminase